MVELIVVFVILAVLGGISLTLLNPKKYIDQAKDAKRAHDLTQIQNALDTYYNDYNCYPVSLDELNSGQTIYMKDIPKDPDTGAPYPYEIDVDKICPQWNVLFAKASTRSNMRSACPLEQFSDCIPPNYDSSYICVLSGKIDCTYIKSVTILPPIDPTGAPTPTPTPTLNPTPTEDPTNTPTPTGLLSPTPTSTLSPTPTSVLTPTPTFPPPPTPTPTWCLKNYACRGTPPTCNQVGIPDSGDFCSANCNGACP